MPFSTGQTPPSEGSEAVLDAGEVEVGVLLEDPVGMLEEDTDSPVEVLIPDVGAVELTEPIGTAGEELGMVGADLGGPDRLGRGLVVDVEIDGAPGAVEVKIEVTTATLEEVEAVELMEATGGPEETALPKVLEEPEEAVEVGRGDVRPTLFEGEAIVIVLLGDSGTLMLDVTILPETVTVVKFAREGTTVSVVVILSKSVPEIVPSL